MSTVDKATDTILVNRAGTDYNTTVETMSTLADTDLLLINRGGVDYRCEAKDVKAALGGPPLGQGTEINPEGLDVFGFGWLLWQRLWDNPGSILILIRAYTVADKSAWNTYFAKTVDGGLTWQTAIADTNGATMRRGLVAYHEPQSLYYRMRSAGNTGTTGYLCSSPDGLNWTEFTTYFPSDTGNSGQRSLAIQGGKFNRWATNRANGDSRTYYKLCTIDVSQVVGGTWVEVDSIYLSNSHELANVDPWGLDIDVYWGGSYYGLNIKNSINNNNVQRSPAVAGVAPYNWHNGCACGTMQDGYVWRSTASGHQSSMLPAKVPTSHVVSDFTLPYVMAATDNGTIMTTTDMQAWAYVYLPGWNYEIGKVNGLVTDGSCFLVFAQPDGVSQAIYKISY
jgi:hypothetical protein